MKRECKEGGGEGKVREGVSIEKKKG